MTFSKNRTKANSQSANCVVSYDQIKEKLNIITALFFIISFALQIKISLNLNRLGLT